MIEEARRLTAEDVLLHMRVPEHDDLYVIGCFEKRVTVRSQQVRALNLIYSLYKRGAVPAGARIAVVGGGAAGLTAAAGAARLGYRVTLLERSGTVLPIFQGNTTRWLHPYIYDWPETPGSERHDGGTLDPDEAGLPLLSWRADFAGAVARELEGQWAEERERHEIRVRCDVDSISLGSGAPRYVNWNVRREDEEGGNDGDYFEAVILAVGFGEESRFPGVPWVSYWRVDPLHQEGGREDRHLISGCGDGGLIDLLRVKLRGFDHGRFTQSFVRLPALEPLKKELLSIDEEARKEKNPGAWLRDRYKELTVPAEVDAFIKEQLRDTRATLTGLEESPLTLNASTLNRFLASRLLRRFGVHYRPGGFTLKSEKAPYTVQFTQGGEPEIFDHITCRHGPVRPSAIETHFPTYAPQFQKLRERNVLDQTRWPIWEKGIFAQGRQHGHPQGPAPAGAPRPPFVGVPSESLGEGFKGRQGALEELHALLRGSGQVALTSGGSGRVYAHGGGGIGKSRLAIEYAYRYRGEYPGGVFFARVERRAPLELWAEFARKLFPGRSLPQDEEAALAFAQRLGDAAQGRQLIIFDDVQADTREELHQRLRGRVEVKGHALWPLTHEQVSLLMTTRMRDIPGARGVAVERLDPEAATDLLLEKAGLEAPSAGEREEALELASGVLGGHPLAISLAGAYIRRGQYSLSEYQGFIREKGLTDRLEAAAREVGSEIEDHERSIAATYELSRKQLDSGRGVDVLAGQLLRIAAFLEPGTAIDRKLLARLLRAMGTAAEMEQIGLALARLTKDLALLDGVQGREAGVGDVLIHPLIADYTRWRMQAQERKEFQRMLLEELCRLFPGNSNEFWKITVRDAHSEWEHLSAARESHITAVWNESRGMDSQARSILSRCLGDLYLQRGSLNRAGEAYQQALEIGQRLAEREPANAEWQRDVSVSLNKLGDVLSAQGELEGARRAYEQALEIGQRLAEREPANAEWQRDVSVSLNKLGDVLSAQGELEGARRAYEQALELRQRLAEREPANAVWQRDVSVSLNKLGDVLSAQGELEGARRAYEQALELRQRLAEREPANAVWQRDVSVSLNKLGDVLSAQGELEGARRAYEQALEIGQRLAEREPANAVWQRDVSVSLNKLGDVLSAQGELEGARRAYEQALEIGQRLAEREPANAEWQRDVSVSLNKLGDVLSAQGELEGARRAYEQALELRQRLAERDPDHVGWQTDLVVSQIRIASILATGSATDRVEAVRLLTTARDTLLRFAANSRLTHAQQHQWLPAIEAMLRQLEGPST